MIKTTIGRLLNMRKNCAAMNMAIDEAILLAQKAQPQPTLRFYDWTQPAFSFGYFRISPRKLTWRRAVQRGLNW